MKEMWNEDEMLLEKPEIETVSLCECIAGTVSKDFDVVITNKEEAVYLWCYDWRLGAA